MTDRHQEFLRVLLGHLGAVETVDQITPTANLRALGLNSMRAVDLVMDLEDEFDLEFGDEALMRNQFSTFGEVIAYVAAQAGKQAS